MNDMPPEAKLRAAGGRVIRPPLKFGKLVVLSMDDIVATTERDYLLKGLMSPAEMSIWWGPPKCGKSFLMLRIAYAIAQGKSIFGRRVHACPVLYVAAEGEAGLAGRLRAIHAEMGDAPRFKLIAQPIDLLRPKADLEHLKTAALDPRIGARLIVLDTLSRVIAGGDENASQDMGNLIGNVGVLRSYTDAHVAIVHHGTKNPNGSTPRGHGSLIGASDLVVEIAKAEDGNRTATVTAAKDDPDGAVMGFKLRVVELGNDQDGDPVTTCIADETEPARPTSRLNATEQKARQFLADLIAAEGTPLPVASGFPDALLMGVPEKRWRDECESRRLSTADAKESRGKAFKRAYAGLQQSGIVATRDDIVWLTHQSALPR